MNDDPIIDPNTAPTVGQSANQPYARRSITTVFFLIGGTLLLIFFLFFWLWGGDEQVDKSNNSTVTSTQMPGNMYEEGSGRGATYNFFYKMFGGIEDGLEDSPHNLNNVDRLDNLNLETATLPSGDPVVGAEKFVDDGFIIKNTTINVPKPDDGYQHSVFDVIGSDVQGYNGESTGTIHDILINRKTGEASGIILNEDGIYYNQDLKILKFTNVASQAPDGNVKMLVTEDTVENRPDFNYAAVQDTSYISLRKLRNSRILSHSGEIIGETDAVIYADAEAQGIYFRLKPSAQNQNTSNLFELPYDAVRILKGENGYYIQLTQAQTKFLINKESENK